MRIRYQKIRGYHMGYHMITRNIHVGATSGPISTISWLICSYLSSNNEKYPASYAYYHSTNTK